MLVAKVVGNELLQDNNNRQNQSNNGQSSNNQLKQNTMSKLSIQIEKLENQMEIETQVLASYGMDKAIKSYSIEDRTTFIQSMFNNFKIRRLSDIIGSLKKTNNQKKSNSENSISINDVVLGDNIPKILPSERMKLSHDITKKDFYNKYLNKQLLQYDNGESGNKYKGSLIVCIDMSSSMEIDDNELYAKALMVKLHDIAVKEHRNFVVILFADEVLDVFEHSKSSFNAEKFKLLKAA
jgi:uncharacterized protein with von Willebrand factor type A (vWA) domain